MTANDNLPGAAHNDVQLSLRWPPSVNGYWVHRQRGTFISAFGEAYRKEVWVEFKKKYPGRAPLTCRLAVSIVASPPDNRERDLDNILKSLLDSMQHAGVYKSDSQIDTLQIARTVERHDAVNVTVHQLRGGAGLARTMAWASRDYQLRR